MLSEVEIPPGSDGKPSAIIASPAVARSRIYIRRWTICSRSARRATAACRAGHAGAGAGQDGPAATLLVTPTEVILKPGEPVSLTVRAFDANGNRLAAAPEATWMLEGLKGTIAAGKFTPDAGGTAQAGVVNAPAGALPATSRIRVIPDLPWTFDFESIGDAPPPQWANATGKFAVRDLDGSKVLVKLAENPFAFAKRCRPFFGSPDYSDYTIEADVRGIEKHRQMGDVGIVAGRYELVLFANHGRLELQPWQPEVARTQRVDFPVKKDTWYVLKLEVHPLGDGKTRVRGKAWEKGQPEPTTWLIERIDPIGSSKGSPGLYADVTVPPSGGGWEVYWDNIKGYKNGASPATRSRQSR